MFVNCTLALTFDVNYDHVTDMYHKSEWCRFDLIFNHARKNLSVVHVKLYDSVNKVAK